MNFNSLFTSYVLCFATVLSEMLLHCTMTVTVTFRNLILWFLTLFCCVVLYIYKIFFSFYVQITYEQLTMSN